MKNRFRKVLSVLLTIALLVSGYMVVFAEDAVETAAEAPVVETVEAAEEALAQEETHAEVEVPVQEEIPVQEEAPAEEEVPAAVEAPAEVEAPVQEEVPVQEEAPAQEEVPAQEEAPAQENVSAQEEAPAQEDVPAQEGTPVQEEPVPAAEEEAVQEDIIVEDIPAVAEETAENTEVDEEVSAEEEAPAAEDETENPAEEADINNEVIASEEQDEETEENPVEIVEEDIQETDAENNDSDVADQEAAEDVPEMTEESVTELKIGSRVSGTASAEADAIYCIKSSKSQAVVLGLYTNDDVQVKINGETLRFVPDETDATFSTCELNLRAGETYMIEVSANTASFTLTVEAKETETEETEATDEQSAAPAAEDEVAQEETTEEVVPAEDINNEETDTEETVTEEAEKTNETEEAEQTEETEETEEAEEEVPAINAWVVADSTEYAIGDTVTLTAAADIELDNAIAWQTSVDGEEWHKAGYGQTLTVELTEENANSAYRFKLADGTISEVFNVKSEEKLSDTVENSEIAREHKVSFTYFWDEKEPSIGSIVHMKASLTGYEDVDYVLQWQYCENPDISEWTDYPGANSETLDLQITEENNNFYWRVIVYLR